MTYQNSYSEAYDKSVALLAQNPDRRLQFDTYKLAVLVEQVIKNGCKPITALEFNVPFYSTEIPQFQALEAGFSVRNAMRFTSVDHLYKFKMFKKGGHSDQAAFDLLIEYEKNGFLKTNTKAQK